MFKVNNINTRKRFEICSKLTIKKQNDVSDSSFKFTCFLEGGSQNAPNLLKYTLFIHAVCLSSLSKLCPEGLTVPVISFD